MVFATLRERLQRKGDDPREYLAGEIGSYFKGNYRWGVEGLGVQGLGFRVQGLGFRGFRVYKGNYRRGV